MKKSNGHQIRAVDESRLGKTYGHLRPDTVRKVRDALDIIFDVPTPK